MLKYIHLVVYTSRTLLSKYQIDRSPCQDSSQLTRLISVCTSAGERGLQTEAATGRPGIDDHLFRSVRN